MINRELILKRVQKPEDRLIVSKVLDKAELAEKARKYVHTDFLDPYQQGIIQKALSGYDGLDFDFDGGYFGAERAVAFFRPDFFDDDEDVPENIFKLVNIKLNGRDNLSHRDYLGALMGLGLKREKTGDIIVGNEQCDVVVIGEIAEYISCNLDKVGSTGASVQVKDMDDISVPQPKIREISATVASLRLDCVCAPGFGMSRSKVADFIKAGKLNLNWEMTDNPAKAVKEGDTLSIRGKGRVVIEKVGGKTKKDRTGVILKKYV